MARMKRLQISLEPEMDETLSRAARRDGISKAEVVRRSLSSRFQAERVIDLPSANLGGLQPGVNLDDGRALRDLMDGVD